jgi:hypothetical protein
LNTTENLVAAQMELARMHWELLGDLLNNRFETKLCLTKQMGLTAEEAGGIQQLAMANGNGC